jgi:hypothetical protein
LAKNVIQVHTVDAAGKVVTNRAFKRDKLPAWCAELPPRLPRGDGSLYGRPPLVPRAARTKSRRPHDSCAVRRAIPYSRHTLSHDFGLNRTVCALPHQAGALVPQATPYGDGWPSPTDNLGLAVRIRQANPRQLAFPKCQ